MVDFSTKPKCDDLFELVWRGATGGGGMEGKPSCCNLTSSSRAVAVVLPVPEGLVPPPPAPPSEAEMASWFFPIVCGQECAGGGGAVVACRRAWMDDDQTVPSGKESSDHKLQVKMKTSSTGGRPRSHHHAEAHSLAEKRRRCKIKEKLKTLQQLVPGCDNAMSSFRCGMKPTSVAVYPVVQQAPCLACWQGGTSVQREGSWAGPPSYSSVLRPCFHGHLQHPKS